MRIAQSEKSVMFAKRNTVTTIRREKTEGMFAMPRFCVMTFMFKPWWNSQRMSIEEMLDGFGALGVEGVEPFHRDFVEEPGLAKRYRAQLDGLGMKVAAVDVMCNLVYADENQKKADRDELRRGLDICKELGAEIAHVAGHKLRDGVTPSDGRKMIAEGLLDAADLAESYGLTLAIEDFDPSPTLVCSASDCLEILDLCGGRVKLVFDTGNFSACGERADDVFDRMASRIAHVHIKDGILDSSLASGRKSCDIGKGDIPNAAIAKMLNKIGYRGWVALETHGRDQMDPVSAIRMELPVLQKWFSE
jgi:sugar phosphate isomerase/epimerase